MDSNTNSRVIVALVVAIGIFFLAVVLPKLLLSSAVPTLATTQALELLLSLLAIAILGRRRFADYGFCLPNRGVTSPNKKRWVGISLTAPLLGIAATSAILVLGGKGNPIVRSLTLPQIILFIWVFSSAIEEVFTRGFLQGHLSGLSGRYANLLLFRVELPVLISALFFASMHLVLLYVGADAITTSVTLLFTFSIGLMAGHLRARTGSLIPAIVVHMLANFGGMIGGIIYTFINFLITGELPAPR